MSGLPACPPCPRPRMQAKAPIHINKQVWEDSAMMLRDIQRGADSRQAEAEAEEVVRRGAQVGLELAGCRGATVLRAKARAGYRQHPAAAAAGLLCVPQQPPWELLEVGLTQQRPKCCLPPPLLFTLLCLLCALCLLCRSWCAWLRRWTQLTRRCPLPSS